MLLKFVFFNFSITQLSIFLDIFIVSKILIIFLIYDFLIYDFKLESVAKIHRYH